MTVTQLSGLVGGSQQQIIQKTNTKLQTAIASLLGSSSAASSDVASLSTAAQLQTATVSLKQLSNNLTENSSLAQVADDGLSQIQVTLSKLQAIASQANAPGISADQRSELSQQFQKLAAGIDSIVKNTTFKGQPLLDGNSHAASLDALLENNNSSGDINLGDFSTASLLGNNTDLLTPDDTSSALTAVSDALTQVSDAKKGLDNYRQSLDYADASISSAVANQDAAFSLLQDKDFDNSHSILDTLQQQSDKAVAAQGNRINPALLDLVS